MTKDQFLKIAGNGVENTDYLVKKLNEVLIKYEITTDLRVSHFMAQLCQESKCFTKKEENLDYSAKRLTEVFPYYFRHESLARKYAHNPEKLANLVYSNRIGNGSDLTGDGWKYRGRGFIQITGKSNYQLMSKLLNYDLMKNPNVMSKDSVALYSAGAYWKYKNLNKFADKDDIKIITKLIHGDCSDVESREKYLKLCKEVLYGSKG